ncbi:MAG: leucine-rich repeat domain-containing protein [Candidatus Helarchaeota archaeon]|nr:leucine-rich repeat domain-containing protein [Candidatus Helarchaeota archaeon]
MGKKQRDLFGNRVEGIDSKQVRRSRGIPSLLKVLRKFPTIIHFISTTIGSKYEKPKEPMKKSIISLFNNLLYQIAKAKQEPKYTLRISGRYVEVDSYRFLEQQINSTKDLYQNILKGYFSQTTTECFHRVVTYLNLLVKYWKYSLEGSEDVLSHGAEKGDGWMAPIEELAEYATESFDNWSCSFKISPKLIIEEDTGSYEFSINYPKILKNKLYNNDNFMHFANRYLTKEALQLLHEQVKTMDKGGILNYEELAKKGAASRINPHITYGGRTYYLKSKSTIDFSDFDFKDNYKGVYMEHIGGWDTLENYTSLKIVKKRLKSISGLESLKRLTYITFKWNLLKEIKGLENLINLKKLTLSGNKIEKIRGLDSLINLNHLDLRWNSIFRIEGLDSLENLTHLNLDRNPILRIEGLSNLTNLKELSISDTRISNIEGLDCLKSLETLKLKKNGITEIKGLDKLQNLKSLYLSENQLQKMNGIEKLINLENLYLDNNNITNINGLNSLINLRRLSLENNKITEIKGLDTLVNLKWLNLTQNKIRKLKGLENLESLRDVYFSRYGEFVQLEERFTGKGIHKGRRYVRECRRKLGIE